MPACDRDPRNVVGAVDHFAGAPLAMLFFLPLLLES
jgi:hypothetical protein